jgi:hypothetical protein
MKKLVFIAALATFSSAGSVYGQKIPCNFLPSDCECPCDDSAVLSNRIFGSAEGFFNGTGGEYFLSVHYDDRQNPKVANVMIIVDGKNYEVRNVVVVFKDNTYFLIRTANTLAKYENSNEINTYIADIPVGKAFQALSELRSVE